MLIFFFSSKNTDEMTTHLGRCLISEFYYHIPYFSRCHIQPGQFSMYLTGSQAVLKGITYAVICTKCSGCEVEMAYPCPHHPPNPVRFCPGRSALHRLVNQSNEFGKTPYSHSQFYDQFLRSLLKLTHSFCRNSTRIGGQIWQNWEIVSHDHHPDPSTVSPILSIPTGL